MKVPHPERRRRSQDLPAALAKRAIGAVDADQVPPQLVELVNLVAGALASRWAAIQPDPGQPDEDRPDLT